MSLLSTPTAAQSPSAISSGTLAQSSSTSKVHSPSPSRSAIVSSRPLLLRLRKHRGQRPPDAEMAVADPELRRVESASLEIPQDGRPALHRFAIAALDGEEDLLPVPQRRQDDEDRGLLLLQPGFHVHAVHPQVDDLEVLERARLPELVLGLPARLEAAIDGADSGAPSPSSPRR